MEAVAKKTEYSFARFEKKYRLNTEEYQKFIARIKENVHHDDYYESSICSIYFDTDDFRLIRESIEKPIYKEKFRIRSYGIPNENSDVFLEIKKKYKGTVYKRRIMMPLNKARAYLTNYSISENQEKIENKQIFREIDWFLHSYNLLPKAFIAYDRLAYVGNEDDNLRITFDKNIRYRTDMLDMKYGDFGLLIDNLNPTVMEIKFQNTIPLWLADDLCNMHLYPTPFSKYGQVYKTALLFNNAAIEANMMKRGGVHCA